VRKCNVKDERKNNEERKRERKKEKGQIHKNKTTLERVRRTNNKRFSCKYDIF
jgi:P2-related tail formation protein